jgi:protein-S-isoprenylcysteine O-methyltransferase Ste14
MTAMQIVTLCWGVFFLYWLIAARGSKRTKRRESLAAGLCYSAITASGFFLLCYRGLKPTDLLAKRWLPATPLVEAIGITLTVAGLVFAIWARRYLGRNWSAAVTVKEEHQLIRTGPYRWVRHPIYSGMILSLVGAALVDGEFRGILAILLVLLGFYIKSRMEDGFMQNTFGEEYEAYRKSTGALIPRIR